MPYRTLIHRSKPYTHSLYTHHSFILLYFISSSIRYNGYVTALAHHVISMWFIRCRIQYRPAVAKFINKVNGVTDNVSSFSLSLQSLSYLLSVGKDQLLFNYPNTSPPANVGTDSASRKRSLSFTLITSHVSIPSSHAYFY